MCSRQPCNREHSESIQHPAKWITQALISHYATYARRGGSPPGHNLRPGKALTGLEIVDLQSTADTVHASTQDNLLTRWNDIQACCLNREERGLLPGAQDGLELRDQNITHPLLKERAERGITFRAIRETGNRQRVVGVDTSVLGELSVRSFPRQNRVRMDTDLYGLDVILRTLLGGQRVINLCATFLHAARQPERRNKQ